MQRTLKRLLVGTSIRLGLLIFLSSKCKLPWKPFLLYVNVKQSLCLVIYLSYFRTKGVFIVLHINVRKPILSLRLCWYTGLTSRCLVLLCSVGRLTSLWLILRWQRVDVTTTQAALAMGWRYNESRCADRGLTSQRLALRWQRVDVTTTRTARAEVHVCLITFNDLVAASKSFNHQRAVCESCSMTRELSRLLQLDVSLTWLHLIDSYFITLKNTTYTHPVACLRRWRKTFKQSINTRSMFLLLVYSTLLSTSCCTCD